MFSWVISLVYISSFVFVYLVGGFHKSSSDLYSAVMYFFVITALDRLAIFVIKTSDTVNTFYWCISLQVIVTCVQYFVYCLLDPFLVPTALYFYSQATSMKQNMTMYHKIDYVVTYKKINICFESQDRTSYHIISGSLWLY